MNKITIFQFTVYDIATDENRISQRWGTAQGIARVRGEPIGGSAVEVEESAVQSDVWELTNKGFNPHSPLGMR